MAKRKKRQDIATLLLQLGLELDRTERGITIRLKDSAPPEPQLPIEAIRISPTPIPQLTIDPAPTVVYSGMRIVNGRVIREGRHSTSQWNYVGLAGAMPRRVMDYHPEVVLERRADEDGIVRLLPIQDTPGEPLGELQYVVVDVETTGAGFGRGHRITEVAIVHLNGAGKVLDEFCTLVNPERPIPRMITELTHIDAAMVRNAPRFREIALEVRDRLEGRIFVAHNAGFDWGFLSMELVRTLGAPLRGRMLCTVRLARKFVPEVARRSLDSLSWYFGVPNEARHRAFGDARATAVIFSRMMDRAADREIVGWNELQKVLYARAPKRKRRATPHFFDPTV